ncbi:hypothetical protein HGRIS_007252 [Hohenbuehelia grisea]|uniref:DUF6534 domain-containing protein n=1 Tax=Hohenbuehelia grisea TaxID=104357 RepID=A0ABR3JCP9_9AGAR
MAAVPDNVLNSTLGAAFIGAMIAAVLYGITTLQTYFYFSTYPNDRTDNKILAGWVWILDTIQLAFVSHALYHYTVTNYANPVELLVMHWSLPVSTIFNIIMAITVHFFFILRIYHLAPRAIRVWLACFIGVLAVCRFCFGIETIVWELVRKEFSKLQSLLSMATLPFAIFAVSTDISVAVSLSVLLYRRRTGIPRTNIVLTTLIIHAVNRCVLTSVVSVAEIILFVTKPNTFWFVMTDFIAGKLYANSLLATLNTRKALQRSQHSELVNIRLPDTTLASSADTKV